MKERDHRPFPPSVERLLNFPHGAPEIPRFLRQTSPKRAPRGRVPGWDGSCISPDNGQDGSLKNRQGNFATHRPTRSAQDVELGHRAATEVEPQLPLPQTEGTCDELLRSDP